MKALGPRFSFYAGFVVGIFTLYAFMRQVGFEKSLSTQQLGSSAQIHDHQLEDENKIWKKEGSALFNLKHPHHIGMFGLYPEM